MANNTLILVNEPYLRTSRGWKRTSQGGYAVAKAECRHRWPQTRSSLSGFWVRQGYPSVQDTGPQKETIANDFTVFIEISNTHLFKYRYGPVCVIPR
jgi:hypothetical protein